MWDGFGRRFVRLLLVLLLLSLPLSGSFSDDAAPPRDLTDDQLIDELLTIFDELATDNEQLRTELREQRTALQTFRTQSTRELEGLRMDLNEANGSLIQARSALNAAERSLRNYAVGEVRRHQTTALLTAGASTTISTAALIASGADLQTIAITTAVTTTATLIVGWIRGRVLRQAW